MILPNANRIISLLSAKPSKGSSSLSKGQSPLCPSQLPVSSIHLQPSPPYCCLNTTAMFLLQGFSTYCTLSWSIFSQMPACLPALLPFIFQVCLP